MGARSELGGTHCLAHAAFAVGAESAVSGGGHAQFHVDGQSVSTVQGPVGWATHVLQVIDVHALASVGLGFTPGRTTPAGGRRLAQGVLVAIAYDGTFASGGGASTS